MAGWSRDPETGELFCTSLQQVQDAREKLSRALGLNFNEPQLRAELEKSLRMVNSMEKRVFTGNWFMVVILGLFYVVPGLLWWYVNRRPQYLINRDYVAFKNTGRDESAGTKMGGMMGKIYAFCEESGEWGWLFGLFFMFTIGVALSPIFMILAYKENYLGVKNKIA